MNIHQITWAALVALLLTALIYGCGTESKPVYQISVTADPAEGGTVNPTFAEVEEGEEIQITATPNQNWLFSGWQGDHTGPASEATLTVTRDLSITAVFEKVQHPLTVTTTGNGSVSQQIVSAKTDYDNGTMVRLNAEPAEYWNFIEWQGSLTGNQNPVEIEIDQPKQINALFEINTYTLTTAVQGEGSVAVDPDKDIYEHGDSIEVTAQPQQGWSFEGWEGDLSGSDNPITISIESDLEITAVFEQDLYEVTVSADGQGSVSYQPVKDHYLYGDEIQLQASPGSGNEFIRWQGSLSSTNINHSFVVTDNHDIVAVFRDALDVVRQRWGSRSTFNNQLISAGLSLENGLPEQITVTNFRLLNQNGTLVGQSSENHNVPPGSSLTYTVSFNTFVAVSTFSNYTGDWRFTYKGKNYRKTTSVGSFGSASKIVGGVHGSKQIIVEDIDP